MTKENEVKRYKIHSHSWQMLEVDGDSQETEYEGPWVKYSDYQALQKRLEDSERSANRWYTEVMLTKSNKDKLNKAIEAMKDVIENYECGLEVDGKINTVLKEVEK